MNKFHLLPLSLILFNPIFSDESEVHVLPEYEAFSTEKLQNEMALNPQLLKEFEENLALLLQKKNRKSTENQETETTPELQEENNSEKSVINDQASTGKETILPLSNDSQSLTKAEKMPSFPIEESENSLSKKKSLKPPNN